jgi:hypothetical protein
MPKEKGLKNNMNDITSPPSEIEIAEMLEYLRGTEYHMILRRLIYQRDVFKEITIVSKQVINNMGKRTNEDIEKWADDIAKRCSKIKD